MNRLNPTKRSEKVIDHWHLWSVNHSTVHKLYYEENIVVLLCLWLFYLLLQRLMERYLQLWINRNITDHIQEPKPSLATFICSKVLAGRAPQDILCSMRTVSYIWHCIPEYCDICVKVSICSLMQILNDLSQRWGHLYICFCLWNSLIISLCISFPTFKIL
jgi:hypothetical protein